MTEPALRIRDLAKSFADPSGGRRRVLEIQALDLERGGSMTVTGESGSGKTTLLHCVAGILPIDSGRIEVGGERMSGASEMARDRLRARHIGYLFQTFNLLPHLTAVDNVALGLAFGDRTREAIRPLAAAALERVGLGAHLRHRPGALSVGQQQRVAVARALVGRPTLVLADEPTANLDPARGEEVLDLLTAFTADTGAALLVVTHEPRVQERFEHHLQLPTLTTGSVS